jgi:hypothetical protein
MKVPVHMKNTFALLCLNIVFHRSFEVFMTATQTAVFLTVILCEFVGTYQHSREQAVVSLELVLLYKLVRGSMRPKRGDNGYE